MKSVPSIHWKDWCWRWNSTTLATWCEELTHLKRPWCWERLRVGGEGDDRGWGGWMASLTQWTWAWVNSGSWWWTGKPGLLQSMGLQRVRHNWATDLNWTKHMQKILENSIYIEEHDKILKQPHILKTLLDLKFWFPSKTIFSLHKIKWKLLSYVQLFTTPWTV